LRRNVLRFSSVGGVGGAWRSLERAVVKKSLSPRGLWVESAPLRALLLLLRGVMLRVRTLGRPTGKTLGAVSKAAASPVLLAGRYDGGALLLVAGGFLTEVIAETEVEATPAFAAAARARSSAA